ncbi:MAG: TVP38/TMEM64 family protein, partial [Deltaproteobacteria bacterium]|nr:TVP38/TMEM64 family protein [Deltaproteobacteria bacterium]
EWVAKKSGERLNRIMRGVEAEGWRFIAFVRLVPLFPFNLLNYALGLTRIAFGVYVLTSAICMVPGAFAYTWLGYAGRQAAAGNQGMIRDLLLAAGVFAGLALLPRLVRRVKEQQPLTGPRLHPRGCPPHDETLKTTGRSLGSC